MTDKQTAEERARRLVRDKFLRPDASTMVEAAAQAIREAEQAARQDEREKCVLKFEQLWPGHSVTAAKLRALGSGDEK